jgi:uncharacterized membrane protein
VIPVVLALGSSLAWGLADFLGGLKSRSLALPTVLLLSQAVGLVITVAVVALAGEAPAASATLGWAALSGILDLAGLWALYRGLSRESMSVVAPWRPPQRWFPPSTGSPSENARRHSR